MMALAGALEAFEEIDIGELARKSRALGDLCIALADKLELRTISPRNGARRGGHVSLIHPEGYAIVQALAARGVIADFRAPDAMRFGFSPLFVRYADVWDAMDQLGDVLATRAWDRPEFKHRTTVT
jgi:kynureninase